MDVKRYDLEPDCTVEPSNGSMYERKEGEYVLFTDYETLAAEVRRLKEMKLTAVYVSDLKLLNRAEAAEAKLAKAMKVARDMRPADCYCEGDDVVSPIVKCGPCQLCDVVAAAIERLKEE